ncbi:glycosyltransferase [Synechococcus sp. GEYO]|uniref:glycosyltransferase n=1 Tax=Synechococcus sp. GEYO TaxID=2575511 RepID=UPI000E0E6D4B|nr:glycosyltransferase [Synechococcus sp. GEYO]
MSRAILFIHTNCPAQFKGHIQYHLNKGDSVTFLCRTASGQLPKGVRCLKIKDPRVSDDKFNNLTETQKMKVFKEVFATSYRQLSSQGFYPDLIVSHSGWGAGDALRLCWPKSKIISYIEWWFLEPSLAPMGMFSKTKWMSKSFLQTQKSSKRNSIIALEICQSDLLVAPTLWQKSMLPRLIKPLCNICFDGIDTDFFSPDTTQRSNSRSLLLTYGTRGMEPLRGFPEFVLAAKELLTQRNDVCVEIAGLNQCFYYPSPPPTGKTWGDWAFKQLRPWIDQKKVRFLGRLNLKNYRAFLRRSDVHCYFSLDFVPSWSFFEAAAVGCNIVAWNTLSVKSLFTDLQSPVVLCEPGDPNSAFKHINELFNNPELRIEYSTRARVFSNKYSLSEFNLIWSKLLSQIGLE